MRPRRLFVISIYCLVLAALLLTELRAQGVAYESQGKRDPFLSLIKKEDQEPVTVIPPPPLSERPPGLAGLLISEVSVTGVIAGGGQQMVILAGIDEMTYFAKEGSKLFDGYLDKVSGDQVVFIKEEIDSRGEKHTSRVVKQMQTEDR